MIFLDVQRNKIILSLSQSQLYRLGNYLETLPMWTLVNKMYFYLDWLKPRH